MKLRFFLFSELGAATTEYAIALIVATVIGGAGAIGIAGSSVQTVENGSTVVSAVETVSSNALN